MKQKIAVTLDEDLVAFLDAVASGNRSDYINNLLREQRKQVLETELIAALKSDASDPDYQAEIAVWDSVVGDGIDIAAGGDL
jgi:Arc/MetJ-type ribon-helix-helix transcriptional regulator